MASCDITSSRSEIEGQPSKEVPLQNSRPTKSSIGGSYRAYTTLVGGFLATMVSSGYLASFGVYLDIYVRAGAESAQKISWVGSTQSFLIFGGGIISGKLLDMGYFRYTNLLGSIVFLFSLFMVSIMDPSKYWQIYLTQGLGMGLGAGLIYTPAIAVQGHHWQRRRSLAVGIALSDSKLFNEGSTIGGIIFPIMLNHLFKSSVGFEWGVRASAFLCFGLLTASNILMVPNRDVDLSIETKPDIRGILMDRPFQTICLCGFFTAMGANFPYFYLQLLSILHGIKPETAFYSLTVLNAGALIGQIVPNFFADKYGPGTLSIIFSASTASLIFVTPYIRSLPQLVIVALFYGFSDGAFSSLAPSWAAGMSRNSSELGVRLGIGFFCGALGSLIGPPIAGRLLGADFAWYKPVTFSGVACFVGTIFGILTRQILVARRGTPFV